LHGGFISGVGRGRRFPGLGNEDVVLLLKRLNMKRLLLWIGVLATLLLVTGCVSSTDGNSNLPWSAPASWEDQTLGIPL
jgi:hypothetical protein